MTERTTRWVRGLVVAVVVGLPAIAAFLFLAVQVSSQPPFCGTCHNMRPYYESWKQSKHHDVACVECHIPPGVESEIRKKIEALSMVTSYFTGTYGSKPWGDVSDRSCLRSGCHAKRLLLGREVYQNVLFDHQPHLTEMRRGKQLRCTSCHSQIVQGQHIAVTASTCFLCHFKNTPLNHGTARCTLCHSVPEKVVTTGGLSFNHADVKRFGMDCVLCHEGVVKGSGEVPRERCYTCHNQPARLEEYGKTESLHRAHVTEHSVACLDCHIEIQHRIPDREEAVATPCKDCHDAAAGHAAVRDLYRGIGAKGVTPRPAAMYLAGIRCEACHTQVQGDHRVASDVSCMACHGPSYVTIYRSWQAGLQHRMEGMTRELQAAKDKLEAAGKSRAGLALAEENLALLQRGHPIHNAAYAVDVLGQALQDVRGSLRDAGETPPNTPPWVEAPYQIECLKCHFGIEYLSATAFGRTFPHQPHTVSARLRCTVCHGDLNNHGLLKLDAAACTSCHERITRPMDVGSEECLKCHTAEIGAVSEQVRFPHEKHIAAGLDCALCHQGVADKPHGKFARSAEALPKLGHSFCSTCHGSDVPGEDGTPPDGANCQLCHTGA
ncbi:MAG TPA: cytochrome c3 family protein [Candidatus Margulisiibacteriota bacterium]|nr:cytochrome c3 family protein [Candidatus Margulisiibacteriota bacterium]